MKPGTQVRVNMLGLSVRTGEMHRRRGTVLEDVGSSPGIPSDTYVRVQWNVFSGPWMERKEWLEETRGSN